MSWMKDLKRRVRLPFEWMGVGLGLLIFPNLTHKGLFRVCDFISRVMYFFDGRGKRRSLANLRLIFSGGDGVPSASYRPTKREEKIIRRSYRNMARTVGHAFWTCRQAAKRVRAVGETDAETRAFLSANHPAITVSAHLGCWEILSQLAFLEGHRMMSVAKPIGTAGMTRLLMRARRSIGQEIVPAEGALKPLMQGLRDGKSLGSNIMLVTVKERTQEIGIRRALGAKPITILTQILSESLVLTVAAGLTGLMLGVWILQLVGTVVAANPLGNGFPMQDPQIDFTVAVSALIVIILGGLLAGWMPAKRAMKIRAIEALREE